MIDPKSEFVSRRIVSIRSVGEFVIVGGSALFLLAYLVPAQTSESANFGLSPRMVPMTMAALIFGFATVNLLADFFVRSSLPSKSTDGLGTALALGIAALAGVLAIRFFGLVVGGSCLVGLAAVAIGMRRISLIFLMFAAAVVLLTCIEWSGL